jgi:hypothetical protein
MYWRMILTRVVSTLHTLIYARINLLVVEAAFRFRRTLTRYCIVERLWEIDMSIETENRLYKDGWNDAINTVVTSLMLHGVKDTEELRVEKERLAKLFFYTQRL